MDGFTILVSVELDGRVVGVLRDEEGSAWLSRSIKHGGGAQLEDFRPDEIGLDGDRTLIGGLLPAGAVSAEVVDRAGERHVAVAANGAYVTVLEQVPMSRPCPVCCRDEHGAPVAPPLPEGWPRAPVLDAQERCPACGGRAWDEVRPTDGSRGKQGVQGGGRQSTPIVVCRSCGFEERMGASITLSHRSMDPEELARFRREREVARQTRLRAVLGEVSFPIYAAEGFTATMTGHGGGSSGPGTPIRVEAVTITQPAGVTPERRRLVIETAIYERDWSSEMRTAFATRKLESWLRQEIRPPRVDRSKAGRVIARQAADRERGKLVARAEREERAILLDGRPAPFSLLSLGDRWVALHRSSGVMVTVSAHKVDPDALSLKAIADPVETLLEKLEARRSATLATILLYVLA